MPKKRYAGCGTITKTVHGTWRGQVMDGYKEDNKRNIVSFSGRTKGEVQEKIREYWIQKELKGISITRHTPFDKWADMWFADYETEVEASTYSGYRYTLKTLKEYFMDTPISDIRTLDINHFFDALRKRELSKSYITKCRSMLIQVFDYAEANQIIGINPARKAKRIREKGQSKMKENSADAPKVYSDSEVDALLRGLSDDLLGHSIRILLGAGLRTQELLALHQLDIAEDGSLISVSKAIKMVDGSPCLGAPKSDRGNRRVPIPEKYRHSAIYLRNHGGKKYIWTSDRESGLYDVGAFRKRYYRAIKRIPGVRVLSPHCCRHTYISNLEKHGVPMEQIARLAGHSKITTTDGYLHTDIGTLALAVSVLNGS